MVERLPIQRTTEWLPKLVSAANSAPITKGHGLGALIDTGPTHATPVAGVSLTGWPGQRQYLNEELDTAIIEAEGSPLSVLSAERIVRAGRALVDFEQLAARITESVSNT